MPPANCANVSSARRQHTTKMAQHAECGARTRALLTSCAPRPPRCPVRICCSTYLVECRSSLPSRRRRAGSPSLWQTMALDPGPSSAIPNHPSFHVVLEPAFSGYRRVRSDSSCSRKGTTQCGQCPSKPQNLRRQSASSCNMSEPYVACCAACPFHVVSDLIENKHYSSGIRNPADTLYRQGVR